jgi:CheY-like chemotaxis protein
MDNQLLANKSVLVVEDEMLVVMAIEDMLADLGCTSVARASNVEQALALIAQQPFDLATLDLNLDGQKSYQVARALGERGVPFAFSTGYGKHGVDIGHRQRPVLNKPFGTKQMLEIVKILLAEPLGEAA